MAQPKHIGGLIPAATQSQEPAKQEYRQPVIIDEQFKQALEAKKIWHCTEEEMKQALRYIYILVGLRGQNYPVGIDKQLLHAYIFKNYGGHTPEELRLAFEMAIQQKLSIRPEDVVCYENFSIAYFSRIMEAYREWSREQIKQLPAPIEKREISAREKLDYNITWALKCLNEINKLPVKLKS